MNVGPRKARIKPPRRFAWRGFHELNTDELYQLLQLRCQVFVVEQRCAYLDVDGKDVHAQHLLAYGPHSRLIGGLRVFGPDEPSACARIGRVVTSSATRGRGLGSWLMQEALEFIKRTYGNLPVELSAQAHLEPFYAQVGFVRTSENYLEDGIPHCAMRRAP